MILSRAVQITALTEAEAIAMADTAMAIAITIVTVTEMNSTAKRLNWA